MKAAFLEPEARLEALEAFHWYETRRSGLGKDFQRELHATIQRIEATPRAFPVVRRQTRRARLRRFPYGVYYREFEDRIVVIAVFHGRRDPRDWIRRSAP